MTISAYSKNADIRKLQYVMYLNNYNIADDQKFIFYMFEYTINGTKLMSLVPVGSCDLIIT